MNFFQEYKVSKEISIEYLRKNEIQNHKKIQNNKIQRKRNWNQKILKENKYKKLKRVNKTKY